MTDYELMGAALAEAEQAAALGEVPVGAVVARDGEIIAAATTHGRPRKTPSTMPSCWPSTRRAKSWAAGGCGSVSCS